MTASATFSSARNVRSSTAPVRTFFSLVRTNAPPLPGFTCWNSTTVTSPSGRSRAMPFLRSLVETWAIRQPLDKQFLRCVGEDPAAFVGHDDGVLDAHTSV